MIKKIVLAAALLIVVFTVAQFATAQIEPAKSKKSEFAKQLVTIVLEATNPELLSSTNSSEPVDKELETIVEEAFKEMLEPVLEKDKKLSIAQKAFVRSNFGQLAKNLRIKFLEIKLENFRRTDEIVRYSMEADYMQNLSEADLKYLITFFATATGQNVLKSIAAEKASDLLKDKKAKLRYNKFAKSASGKHFLSPNTVTVESMFMAEFTKSMEEATAAYSEESLAKMIHNFVVENLEN